MKRIPFLLILAASLLFLYGCPPDDPVIDLCKNGELDPNEEGVDCGGDCLPCHCFDGEISGNETGVDCGGDCDPCPEPTCEDGIMNGNEEGVDCGGPDCPPCTQIKFEEYGTMLYPRSHAAVAVYDGKIYISGGSTVLAQNPTRTLQILDLEGGGIWKEGAEMQEARVIHALHEIGGMLYAIGGSNDNDTYTSSIERYDPELDEWELVDTMLEPRGQFGSCVLGKYIYIVGGSKDSNYLTSDVHRYDTELHIWDTSLPSLPKKRTGLRVEAVDGKIYAIGGCEAGGAAHVATSIYELNITVSNPKWKIVDSLDTPRTTLSTCVLDGRIFCAGGHDGCGANGQAAWSSVEVYAPNSPCEIQPSSMVLRRNGPAICTWRNQFFVFGGVKICSYGYPAYDQVERGVLVK